LVTFRGTDADLALPPTTSHEIAAVRLRELATGGRTPLYAGLRKAARVVAAEQRRDPHRRPLLIVVTDGRATHGPDPASMAQALSRVSTVIVDCESGPVRLGLAGRLATALGAVHLRLDALSADGLRAAAGRGSPLSGTGLSGTGRRAA
jgi:magnesium chelatase subunit D